MSADAVVWQMHYQMTAAEALAWGRAESASRKADLTDRSPEGLRIAQARAEQRRKLIGASRSQAMAMVVEANRADRVAAAREARCHD